MGSHSTPSISMSASRYTQSASDHSDWSATQSRRSPTLSICTSSGISPLWRILKSNTLPSDTLMRSTAVRLFPLLGLKEMIIPFSEMV